LPPPPNKCSLSHYLPTFFLFSYAPQNGVKALS
jgi:hypothetical protein